MQYAILIYDNPDAYAAMDEDERASVTAEYMAIRRDPHVNGGAHLEPSSTATTLRVADSQVLMTDGPFADTKEALAGFFLLEADDLDAATEIAGRVPAARLGGAVEVRPIMEEPS